MEISVFNIAVCDDMKEITAQLVQIAEQQSMKQIQTVKGFYCGGQLMEYMAKIMWIYYFWILNWGI